MQISLSENVTSVVEQDGDFLPLAGKYPLGLLVRQNQ
jgi:hypothetical protein